MELGHHKLLPACPKLHPQSRNNQQDFQTQNVSRGAMSSLNSIEDRRMVNQTPSLLCGKSFLNQHPSKLGEVSPTLSPSTSVCSIPLIERMRRQPSGDKSLTDYPRIGKWRAEYLSQEKMSKRSKIKSERDETALSFLMRMSQSPNVQKESLTLPNSHGMRNESTPLPLWRWISSKPLSNSNDSQLIPKKSCVTSYPHQGVHLSRPSNGSMLFNGRLSAWERSLHILQSLCP